ncbi:hypothetical protein DQ04_00391160 [Trypanosoma grayi]|uniref:hypothetical protein n=1 Tax=Trypanosoma grayi TaxID=71804 RepID=UPI0004F49D6A|nr:hypothetical protein DQ04_00391160 [Trypanosoma grayi]KEG14594.1 hypothetical protein DQ04_00391160 [Trypanosoma grayi]
MQYSVPSPGVAVAVVTLCRVQNSTSAACRSKSPHHVTAAATPLSWAARRISTSRSASNLRARIATAASTCSRSSVKRGNVGATRAVDCCCFGADAFFAAGAPGFFLERRRLAPFASRPPPRSTKPISTL